MISKLLSYNILYNTFSLPALIVTTNVAMHHEQCNDPMASEQADDKSTKCHNNNTVYYTLNIM